MIACLSKHIAIVLMEYRVQIVHSIRVVESIDEYIRADNEWYIVFEEEKLFHPCDLSIEGSNRRGSLQDVREVFSMEK